MVVNLTRFLPPHPDALPRIVGRYSSNGPLVKMLAAACAVFPERRVLLRMDQCACDARNFRPRRTHYQPYDRALLRNPVGQFHSREGLLSVAVRHSHAARKTGYALRQIVHRRYTPIRQIVRPVPRHPSAVLHPNRVHGFCVLNRSLICLLWSHISRHNAAPKRVIARHSAAVPVFWSVTRIPRPILATVGSKFELVSAAKPAS